MAKEKTQKKRRGGGEKYQVIYKDQNKQLACDLCAGTQFIKFDGAVDPTKTKEFLTTTFFGNLGGVAFSQSITMLICDSCKLCKTFASGHKLELKKLS